MGKDDLKSQLEFTKQIKANIGAINLKLADQIKMQNLVNLSLKGQLDKAAEAGNITDEAMKKAGISATTASGAVGSVAGSLDATGVAADEAGAKTEGLAAKAINAADATMQAWDATGDFFNGLISKPVANELDTIQTLYGGLTGPGGPFASRNQLSKKLVDTTMGLNREMTDMDGKWAKLFGRDPRDSIGELSDVMGEFNTLVTGDQGVVDGLRIVNDLSADNVIAMKAYSKAAMLDITDVQNIMSREISRTGKAGTSMIEEVAVFSKKLAAATGDSAKQISQNMVKIIDDTDNFANVTVAQAARISVTLRQLSLSYEDLAGATGQFMDFEGAADSVSKLTSVFGIQMDAMDMMMAAQEDEDTLLIKMRDSFLNAGISARDLTKSQKAVIKEALNLTDIQSVERLLDPTKAISGMADLAAVTDEGVGSMEENMELLREDINDLDSAMRHTSKKMAAHIKESFLAPTQQSLIEFDVAMGGVGRTIKSAIPKSAAMSMKFFGKSLSEVAGIDEAKLKMLKENLGGIADLLKEAGIALKDSDLGKELGGLLEKTGMKKDMESITGGIQSSLGEMTTAFSKSVDNMIKALDKAGLLGESPSPIGRNIAGGIETPFTMAFESMKVTQLKHAKWTEKQIAVGMLDANKDKDYREKLVKKYYKKIQKEQTKSENVHKKAKEKLQKADAKLAGDADNKRLQEAAKVAKKKADITGNAMHDAQKAVQLFENRKATTDWKDASRSYEVAKAKIDAEQELTRGIIDQSKEQLKVKKKTDLQIIESAKAKAAAEKKDAQVAVKRRSAMLGRELKDRESFYGAEARKLGASGKTYDQLSEKDREFYRDKLNLGKNYQAELQKIMSGETFQEGQAEFKQKQKSVKILEGMKARALKGDFDADKLSEKQLKDLKEKHGLTKEMIKEATAKGSNITDIATTGASAKHASLISKEKEKTEEKGESKSSKAAARASRAQAKQLQALTEVTEHNGKLIEIVATEIDKLYTMLDKKQFTQDVEVQLGGKDIVDYIVDNSRGNKGQIALVT